jgi:oxygen-dependent protoporphyrinogen oxidase
MTERHDVVVVGGGIAGLACAEHLKRAGRDVVLLEAAPEVGGALRSDTLDGAVVDLGPQTVHSKDPELLAHIAELGLDDYLKVAGGNGKKRYIVLGGQLVSLPTSPLSAITTKALSWKGKLRVLMEPWAPPGPGGDESAAAFVSRRLGPEVADNLLDPFVSGVHAGDPETLSMRGAFPKLLDAERNHGSLVRWAISSGRAAKKARKDAAARGEAEPVKKRQKTLLFSFDGGLQTWARALAAHVGDDRVHTDTPVEHILPLAGGGWKVKARGREIDANRVVLALPAPQCADLVEPLSSGGARVLRDVPYSPVATVQLIYRRHAIRHPLDGFGMLIPTKEHRPVLGILWVSSLFAGRSPDGTILTTTFVGGARFPERTRVSEDEMVDAAHGQHRELLGATERPIATRVQRWPHAIPRVEFGHVDRLATLDRMEELNPGIHLAGSYGEGGAAVPACWKRGRTVAEAILAGETVPAPRTATPEETAPGDAVV